MHKKYRSMINVAIIGYGLSGRYLQAPFFESNPNFNLHTIVTKTQDPTDQFKKVQVHKHIDDVLNDNQIDLISICSPNNTHAEYATKALLANKHLLVEKPFTPTVADAEALIKLATNKNKVLAVFQNRRFDSDFLTVQKVINSNSLGNISLVKINYNRFKPSLNTKAWKETITAANGIMYDLGAHIIDQSIALFGKPKQIQGQTFIERKDSLIDDAFKIELKYNKLTVILQASLLVEEETPRYEIIGSKGTFTKYGLDVQEDELKAGKSPTDADFGIEPTYQQGKIKSLINGIEVSTAIDTVQGNWSILFNNLHQAIVNNKPLLIQLADVVEQIKIIETIKNIQ